MNSVHDFAASIIARLGMSPSDRLIFGAALLCDAVESLKANPPPGVESLFASLPCDEEEPFKTAIAALQMLDSSPAAAAAIIPEEM